MKVIAVTGSVGTGKTTLAKMIAGKSHYDYLDVNRLIREKGLGEGHDEKKDCFIVDEKKLARALVEFLDSSKKDVVIDSHMSHFLDKKYVDLCIVTKCKIEVLKDRLSERGYDDSKIKDNIEAEIFNVCLDEAKERGHDVIVVDTSEGITEDVLSLLPI